MSTVYRRERKTVHIEYVVPAREPWGACWVEVYKAVAAAISELRADGLLGETQEPSDDRIRMRVEDEAIVVYYEKTEVSR